MDARWRKGLIKIAIAIFTELLLNLAGLDDLANYSEFVFETKYQSGSIELITFSKLL